MRLWPPRSKEWFIELLAAHEPTDESDKRWLRLPLADGHFGLPSYRFLDVAIHEAPLCEFGVRCALPAQLALSNLLRNPVIRPERMQALIEGRAMRRSNKDLGRVVAISRLCGPDAAREWPAIWERALAACHPALARELSLRLGRGLTALLESEDDVIEAWLTSRVGLLASFDVTLDQFRMEARRVKIDATDRIASRARATGGQVSSR